MIIYAAGIFFAQPLGKSAALNVRDGMFEFADGTMKTRLKFERSLLFQAPRKCGKEWFPQKY